MLYILNIVYLFAEVAGKENSRNENVFSRKCFPIKLSLINKIIFLL